MRKSFVVLFLLSSFVLSAFGQPLDISGYRIIQANSSVTIVLPAGTTVQPGGYLVVARNSTQSTFEAAWGVTFGSDVTFINGTAVVAGNGFPVINGDETYTFQNASSVLIEGPTPAIAVGQSVQRDSIEGNATIEGTWSRQSISSATPGSGMVNTNSGKLIISEYSDASAFANEFLELYYDVIPPETGQGTASVTPTVLPFDEPSEILFEVIPETDTLRGFRFIFPAEFNWSMSGASFPPGASASTSGDTLIVTSVSVGPSDTLSVSLPGITVADTTDEFGFTIQTSTDGSAFLAIGNQPRILVYGSPRPISQVKAKLGNGTPALLGKWAVVRGLVTVGAEFGGPSYLQDETAGLAVYDSSVSNNVTRGDDVVLLGVVAPFNGLFEFAPCSLLTKFSEGNEFDTLQLTTAELEAQPQNGVEPYESRLVRVNGIHSVTTTGGAPAQSWLTTGSGTNYLISDAAGTMELRVSSRTNLANLPVPTGTFDVVGVLGQFGTAYQLLPRDIYDVVAEGQGPRIISTPPFETDPTPTSITMNWQTDALGTSSVRYGTTSAYGDTATDGSLTTTHSLTIGGLSPATVYYMELSSSHDSGTSSIGPVIVSTASQSSTGEVNVWFNQSIDASVSLGDTARVANPADRVIARINAAQASVDVCLYSLSGTVGANIAQSLLQAKGRGVSVRVIGEKDNQGTVPWGTLKSGGIPVIDDGFDALNGGLGLMHNKFFVIDNRDSLSDTDDWVIMGSWNATDPGTNNDAQNIVEIQDKALANAYTMEFEEMWGSSTDTPVAAVSRFGARKLDNTPHVFVVGGIPVESYFSPSDRVTGKIINTIDRASSSINFALLTFTRDDIAAALTAKHQAGVTVRGIMDNRTDQGSEFDSLEARGIDLLLDPLGAYLHHKYVIVDAEAFHPNQWLLTGSHNWSSAAENSNNENTLILQSQRLANLYLQEFKARYIASGGTGTIVVRVAEVEEAVPDKFSLSDGFPNPFNPSTSFEFSLPASMEVRMVAYDMLGREVETILRGQYPAGTYRVQWTPSGSSGTYIVVLNGSNASVTRKVVLVK